MAFSKYNSWLVNSSYFLGVIVTCLWQIAQGTVGTAKCAQKSRFRRINS